MAQRTQSITTGDAVSSVKKSYKKRRDKIDAEIFFKKYTVGADGPEFRIFTNNKKDSIINTKNETSFVLLHICPNWNEGHKMIFHVELNETEIDTITNENIENIEKVNEIYIGEKKAKIDLNEKCEFVKHTFGKGLSMLNKEATILNYDEDKNNELFEKIINAYIPMMKGIHARNNIFPLKITFKNTEKNIEIEEIPGGESYITPNLSNVVYKPNQNAGAQSNDAAVGKTSGISINSSGQEKIILQIVPNYLYAPSLVDTTSKQKISKIIKTDTKTNTRKEICFDEGDKYCLSIFSNYKGYKKNAAIKKDIEERLQKIGIEIYDDDAADGETATPAVSPSAPATTSQQISQLTLEEQNRKEQEQEQQQQQEKLKEQRQQQEQQQQYEKERQELEQKQQKITNEANAKYIENRKIITFKEFTEMEKEASQVGNRASLMTISVLILGGIFTGLTL